VCVTDAIYEGVILEDRVAATQMSSGMWNT
jgi:hypothetical protein